MPALVELNYGEWTGRSFHELDSDVVWQQFNLHRATVRVPGGETMQEVQVRAMNELERLRDRHRDQVVAIISHAEWIRSVVLFCLGAPIDLFQRLEINTASITTISLSDFGPTVRSVNAS